MARKGKDESHQRGNSWGHFREPALKLGRRGDDVILEQESSNTVTDLQADYQPLYESVRKVCQFTSNKKARSGTFNVDQVIEAFSKEPLLFGMGTKPGYMTRDDVAGFEIGIDSGPFQTSGSRHQVPSQFEWLGITLQE